MNRFRKTLKNTVAFALALTMFAGMVTLISANPRRETIVVDFNNISIAVNGRRINTEFEPFIFQGRTYLPVRDVASAMGFYVTWEGAANTVHLTSQANVEPQTVSAPGRIARETIVVDFNNIRFAVNGTLVYTEYEPFIFQGRTYLPVRDVANATGFDVGWDGVTNTVLLTTPGGVAPDYPEHRPPTQPDYPEHQPPADIIPIPANIVPRAPARQGGPASPAISAQRAVELARDHLISIGVTNARFDYVYMDMEGGVWVWSVEFDALGRSYEFYVNVDTGAFLRAPAGAGTPTAPTAPTTPGTRENRPVSPAVSLERAIEIGYEEIARRGHTGTFRAQSGMSWERGQWVWELEFRVQGGRLPLVEMYINVDTGAIVKFEWDD